MNDKVIIQHIANRKYIVVENKRAYVLDLEKRTVSESVMFDPYIPRLYEEAYNHIFNDKAPLYPIPEVRPPWSNCRYCGFSHLPREVDAHSKRHDDSCIWVRIQNEG